MQVIFNEEEQGLIMKAAHDTPHATGIFGARLTAMYEANLEQDLDSIIEMLTEETAERSENES